ncbi:hypothetical protein P4G11_20365 [Klebsiella pneumoniae]|uniref:hypothetical protein n=1 Tax=Klebsiella pneumoniae TaxID=573 RepID=UPI00097571BF|nr:hypothetical protein [Klebsiella pneumoniae subsp. pneumoniae]
MSESKTHYRKAFDSPYLSSADIVEPTVLTIARATLESDKTKKLRTFLTPLILKSASCALAKSLSQ